MKHFEVVIQIFKTVKKKRKKLCLYVYVVWCFNRRKNNNKQRGKTREVVVRTPLSINVLKGYLLKVKE